MDEKCQEFLNFVTFEMIKTFKDIMTEYYNTDQHRENYTLIMVGIISSVSATLIEGWSSSVSDSYDDKIEAFQAMTKSCSEKLLRLGELYPKHFKRQGVH